MQIRCRIILLFFLLLSFFSHSIAAQREESNAAVDSDSDNFGYQFLLTWGTWGTGPGQFRFAQGVCVDNQGYVYVADGGYNSTSNHRIQKFAYDSTYITEWGTQGSGPGQFANRIFGITTDSQYIYAVDHDNYRIQKFTLDGVYVSNWGSYGSGNGQFISAHGITISPDNYVYVVDDVNHRIQKFTTDGTYLTQWSCGGSPRIPACDAAGNVYITNTLNHIVRKYDSNGNYLTEWGGHNYPYGVACDRNGYVYVVQSHGGVINKYTSDGVFICQIGSPGTAPGQLSGPGQLTIDSLGTVYVTEPSRVQKFGFNITADIVLYFAFDEGVGGVAHDQSIYGHHGAIYGANWTNGVSGDALIFDGVNDWVQIDHTSVLNVPAITIACWVKMSQGMINHFGSPVHKRSAYHLDIQNAVVKGNINNQYGDHWITDGSILPNQWYFLTLTYVDGDSIRLYVNAIPTAVRECQGVIAQGPDFDLFVGRRQEGDRYFEGIIDEVFIYDRALSHSEVVDLFNNYIGVEEGKEVAILEGTFGATIFRGPLQLPEGKNCKVYDIMGRGVDPDRIQPGVYFVEIEGVVTQKVVKIR